MLAASNFKLFGRTGGYYLFWTGAVYLVTGVTCALYYRDIRPELIQLVWISVLALPFTYPSLGRYFNLDIKWDRKMFDWFKKREYSNVVPFPKPEAVPYIEPPAEPEKPAHTYYRLGLTDNNRVSLAMGYSEITMNAAGVDSMIKLLETYRDLINEEEDNE